LAQGFEAISSSPPTLLHPISLLRKAYGLQ
jgi:hypothetical protein